MRIIPNQSTFIITGGASGLGEACVELLFAAPYYANVVIVDFNEKNGNALEVKLNQNSQKNKALFVKVDITDEKQVQEMISKTVSHFHTISGLINCAGIGYSQTVVSDNGPFSLDAFRRVLDVNVVGNFNVVRLVAQHMISQSPNQEEDGERGVIINTASIAAFEGQIGQAAYSASKGAIVSLTLPLARELSRYNIRCLTIAPGLFMTPMMKQLPEKIQQRLANQVPFPKRMGNPTEYAMLCVHILENRMLNGTTIRLDGSLRMSM